MSDSQNSNKQALRKKIRSLRRSLTPLQQKKAGIALARQLQRSGYLCRTRHVAFYLANDGEISPSYIFESLKKTQVSWYLPVLHPLQHNRLLFCEYRSNRHLKKNRYGIKEPSLRLSRRINPRFLNVVLLPLVAFDHSGNRMGMGGGYYDRTFAFKQGDKSRTPRLIGLAHECQRVEQLPVESWDIPLHSIMTDKRVYRTYGTGKQ